MNKNIQDANAPAIGEAKKQQDKGEKQEDIPQGDLRPVKKLIRPAVVLDWRPTLEAAEIQAVKKSDWKR